MTKDLTRDEVLKRLLKTPPKPFTPKAKHKVSQPKKASAKPSSPKMGGGKA